MSEHDEKTTNTGGDLRSFLPWPAARILKEAAETPIDLSALDPYQDRRQAVDRAHSHVKARWPHLFRSEEDKQCQES